VAPDGRLQGRLAGRPVGKNPNLILIYCLVLLEFVLLSADLLKQAKNDFWTPACSNLGEIHILLATDTGICFP